MFIFENKLEKGPHECSIGILIMHEVLNGPSNEKLNTIKHDITDFLRDKYSRTGRKELKSMHPIDVYIAYYKRFGYSYHLLLQLESILRGKSMPDISSLVNAMFMAEMKNMLLTAGHDLDKIALPLCLKRSCGESYTALNGSAVTTIPGDVMIEDKKGVISSILRGPDARTGIDAKTSRVLFTVYAPPGIEDELIYRHMDDIESYVKVFSNGSATCLKKVFTPG
ncbi:MAG: hypothetical protein JXA46_19825 [Dehalococcoidales bacterium]|nr:hypothetical protein [Dehalococcoidales bacterium]